MDVLKELDWLKVETGSLACLGCGHEHGCDVHGCAILREAQNTIIFLREKINYAERSLNGVLAILEE